MTNKTPALIIGVGGLWFVVILAALLATVKADHYDIMAWSLLTGVLSWVTIVSGFAWIYAEIKGGQNE